MSGSSREALPNVRKWSGGPPKCSGVVWRPSQMYECGREALPDVREWSEVPQDVREWSGGPPLCPGVVGRPSRMFERPSLMSGSGR